MVTDDIKITFGHRSKVKTNGSEMSKETIVETGVETMKCAKKMNGRQKLE